MTSVETFVLSVFRAPLHRKVSLKLIMGDKLAQKLGLAVGDKVRLMITENSQYTPFGRVPMQRLFTRERALL